MNIFYKFLASPQFYSTSFDADHVDVSAVKQRVMSERQLGKGTDFHLDVYDANSGKTLDDDVELSDSHYLITRRIVAKAPGEGSAHQYVE